MFSVSSKCLSKPVQGYLVYTCRNLKFIENYVAYWTLKSHA